MPVNHSLVADGTPLVGAADWNAAHSAPTLAEVLAAGNDPALAPSIVAAGNGAAGGGFLELDPADGSAGGQALINGGVGVNGVQDGGPAGINGGNNPVSGNGAYVYAYGATAAGADGYLEIHSDGSSGATGQVIANEANAWGVWYPVLTSGAGAPGASFVSLLYLDTTGKHAYAWNGSSYTLISDYA